MTKRWRDAPPAPGRHPPGIHGCRLDANWMPTGCQVSSKCTDLHLPGTLGCRLDADWMPQLAFCHHSTSTGGQNCVRAMSKEGRYASIVSEADALEFVARLIDRQLSAASRERPQPNARIHGDQEVHDAFWLLLTLSSQRAVFLQRLKNRHFWPRIRSMIGAPPFGFLRLEDEGILNATGIHAGRKNMAGRASTLSSAEIGSGHFADEVHRVYKVVADDHTTSNEIPVRRAIAAQRVVFDTRVANVPVSERASIAKSSKRRAVFFPSVGEVLTLTPHTTFGIGGGTIKLTVRTVQPRGSKSPVCRLYCST